MVLEDADLRARLGAPDPALARSLSSETQVTASTPPTFIYQTNADTTTPAENAAASVKPEAPPSSV